MTRFWDIPKWNRGQTNWNGGSILFFLSPLSTSNSPHSLFLISFLTSLSPINSFSMPIRLSDPTIQSASLIKYNGDSNRPWKRQTMIPFSLSHLRSHENDWLSQGTMIQRSKALTQWTWVIPTGLFYLIANGGWWLVAGYGWFWVYVGFVTRQKRRWLVGCGWFCWRMGVGVARRILLKGGWLGVGVARRRRRVCEFVPEGRK